MQNTFNLESLPALATFGHLVGIAKGSSNSEALPLTGFRRILLPFDLSQSGIRALRGVADYAERTKAIIHLLHVVRPSEAKGMDAKSSQVDDQAAAASERMLKHWIKRVIQGRAKTFVSIRIGDPVDVIRARAIATRADLIVMTSRSCGGARIELQRSSAERVSRVAPCAVLTIPEKCADECAYSLDELAMQKWRTVLLPVDFSAAAEQALRFASQVARRTGAGLLLAHGLDVNELTVPFVHARLSSWAQRLLEEPVAVQTAVWPGGHSLYAILSEAIRAEANLIVLPTRAHSWARRLRAGSITDGVLRQAPCPVVSINESFSETGR